MRFHRAFALVMACALGGFAANAASPVANPASAEARVQPRGNPLWAIPLNALNVTRERPIFLPSRRPPAPASIAPAPVAAAPSAPARPAEQERLRLRLVGTVAGGESSLAICLNQTNNETVRLRLGENFEGWVLRSVHRREAEFEKLALREVLSLTPPEEAKGAPAPTQVMAGPPPLQTVGAGGPGPGRPPMGQPVVVPANGPPAGKWVDGDGQVIDPPKRH